ncbi:MAG: hypothetical protein IBX50_11075 [Marinospirillum sp.]|uniref:hypothetical protein n=1 Tax=Marinospirillum sp. TaxID=2183934 RepID=UPI0019DC19A4|nr:hypothetical protein [Marinospirillum sp.]MBE0507245.1 hypothetical protein [Marinospirillum sp.]
MKHKTESQPVEVREDKLFYSNDADMEKVLLAVSQSVVESLARAEKIHKQRLQNIRSFNAG